MEGHVNLSVQQKSISDIKEYIGLIITVSAMTLLMSTTEYFFLLNYN